MKKILFAASAMLLSLGAQAQNATNSPYSQYGYGRLSDQVNGASKQMGGLSKGWREGNQVNFGNPASYSSIDSLSFIFDAGMSGQITSFQEGNRKLNANNSSFDYFVGAFRLRKHVGMAFGAMPYATVNYSYSKNEKIGNPTVAGSSVATYTNTYTGTGGFRQMFLGVGVEPVHTKNTSLSVGVNASYLWGSSSKSIVNSYNNAYVNTLSKFYDCSASSFKFDFGAQFQQKIGKKDKLTLGATLSLKQSMNATPECQIISNNSQTLVADTARFVANGEFYTPMTIGAGFVWNHSNRWRVGFDYELQKWSALNYPMYKVVNDKPQYQMESGLFADRSKYTLGGEFCANENSRSWFKRVKCRAGVSYTSPYLKINGHDGPEEYSASFGFGLPITNTYNNRSYLNISAQWVQQNATGLIKENIFCINIGLTFNERWFAKWQVE